VAPSSGVNSPLGGERESHGHIPRMDDRMNTELALGVRFVTVSMEKG